jgi:hypothetical protein
MGTPDDRRHMATRAFVGFVAFAALDSLRALPRALAPVLFCTFDAFLRLAMIDTPVLVGPSPQRIDDRSNNRPTIPRVINRSPT